MDVADELEKIRKLHDSGALTDDEFAKAKDAVLRGAGAEPAASADDSFLGSLLGGEQRTLGDAANRYVSFQIVMGAIALVVFLVVACTIMSNWNSVARFGP
jgi:hypothetical protein